MRVHNQGEREVFMINFLIMVVAAALAAVFLLPEGGMQDITDNSEGGFPSDSARRLCFFRSAGFPVSDSPAP